MRLAALALCFLAFARGAPATTQHALSQNDTTNQAIPVTGPLGTTLLPSVDCMRAMTIQPQDSTRARQLQDELQRVGIWGRTTMMWGEADPEGGRVGCFRGHVEAWKAGVAAGCKHMLVMEDDVRFDHVHLPRWNERAEAFLSSDTPYDMLFAGFDLGFSKSIDTMWDTSYNCSAKAIPRTPLPACTYTVANWRSTHAYVISRPAMRMWQHLKTTPDSEPIDFLLPNRFDFRRRFVVIRPKAAFQRFHSTDITWAQDGAMSHLSTLLASADVGTVLDNATTAPPMDRFESAMALLSVKQVNALMDAVANKVVEMGEPTRRQHESDAEFIDRKQRYFEAFVSDPGRSQAYDEHYLYRQVEEPQAGEEVCYDGVVTKLPDKYQDEIITRVRDDDALLELAAAGVIRGAAL